MAKSKTNPVSSPSNAKLHSGGCHCGTVRYEVTIDASKGSRCNCSICNKVAQLGGAVVPDAFKLLTGAEILSEYTWGSATSRRFFCKRCGIHCFGRGHLKELGGDYVSVNYNTLDDVDPIHVNVVYWDGRHNNWQAGPQASPWPIKSDDQAMEEGATPAA